MNSISDFIRHHISCFVFYVQIVWHTKKSIFLLTVSDGILGSGISYIWIFFFKFLLDYMAEGEYGKAAFWAVFCICASGVAERAKVCISMKRDNAFLCVNTELEARLSELSIEIPYEKMENAEMIRRFETAYKCLGRNYLAVYMTGLTNVVSSLLIFVGAGVISFTLGWWVTVVLIIVIIINAVCHVAQSRYEVEQFNEETSVSRQLEYTRYWLTEKSRAKEVRTYVLHDFVVGKLKEYNEKYFRVLRNFNRKQKKAYMAVYLVSGIQIMAVYSYCAYLFFQGSLTAGDFMLHVSALFSLSSAITNLLEALIDVYKNNQYVNELKQCLELETEVSAREKFTEEFESVEFRNVSFCYAGESKNVLNHVSFTLHKNEKLSLIGENGAGKSTLVKLLAGLYQPTEGEILINGKPIEPEKVNYLPLFSMIFQDYTIFKFSVEENINMGKKHIRGYLQRAASEIGLGHIKPETYISQIFSEEGIELSGGENQKLAMLRALCKEAPVIILDEPTSALSPQSEHEIYEKFGRLTRNRAVIFISHRLSSCRICDRILMLHEGAVRAAGTHEELIKSSPEYREMFNAQAELYL